MGRGQREQEGRKLEGRTGTGDEERKWKKRSRVEKERERGGEEMGRGEEEMGCKMEEMLR